MGSRRRLWGRRLLWILTVGIVCYALVLGALLLLEDRLVYYPTGGVSDSISGLGVPAQDVELHTSAGTPIHARWFPCPDAHGAILYCHGNAGNLGDRTAAIQTLIDALGESVLIMDYPGYGRSGGQPSEAGCYAAADAAYDWLIEEKKLAGEHITLLGKSLGGGVAVDLASRRPHRALILVKTFTSIPDVAYHRLPFLPTHRLMRNRFDNLAKIGQCTRPVFIAHGTDDLLIPFSQGERLFAAAREPKQFFAMPGVGHGWPFFTDDCLAAMKQFMKQTEAKQ